ncbi:hypothetical protein VNO77_24750 [Canavalia gladiata]|uniref:Cytochrome P450 n=1 Tax=Canavalia gladiata TaxID=3824 RepID=A0AAN9L6X6_CANGL
MLASISNNILSNCALGRNYAEDGKSSVKHLSRNVMVHLADFTVRDYFPWLGFVDVVSGKMKKYKATFKTLDRLFDKAIAEHLVAKTEGENSNRKDLVDVLIQLEDSSNTNIHNYDFSRNDVKGLLLDGRWKSSLNGLT